MQALLLSGLGALLFACYWADNFDPAGLQRARVLLTGASAGVGEELACHCARLCSHLVLTAHTEAFLQKVVGDCRKLGAPKVFFIPADVPRRCPQRVVQFALDKLGGLDGLVLNHPGAAQQAQGPSVPKELVGSCRVYRFRPCLHLLGPPPPPGELPEFNATDFVGDAQPEGQQGLPGRVPTSFASPYFAVSCALDSFFGSLQRELDVQDVDVAIATCVLGLQDRASAKKGVRGVTRTKAALVVIRGGAMLVSHVFYPWASTYSAFFGPGCLTQGPGSSARSSMSLSLLLPELLLLREDPHPAILKVGHRDRHL